LDFNFDKNVKQLVSVFSKESLEVVEEVLVNTFGGGRSFIVGMATLATMLRQLALLLNTALQKRE
jgi:hypothetical protein